ncbi:MAG: carbamoyltransferase HypF [Verrucomicrobiales bacterium]|nr:carbamoyltransferase HypF [Verrucomicrobiota bacterium JB025]
MNTHPPKRRAPCAEPAARLRLAVRGAVQGVGFRPFVYQLATELGLTGWVNNSPQGVGIEVEGTRAAAEAFLLRLDAGKPPHSSIHSLEATWLDAAGHRGFEIRPSDAAGATTAFVMPDIATCEDCLAEILDPANRRFRYPFTNCTHCGPRFSMIEALPYDRPNTSMKSFAMCARCQAEYDDPRNRRFHAQPNACPTCGPRLEWWDADGSNLGTGDDALRAAADAIRQGAVVAVKGVGGFHLLVAAHDDPAVQRLRELKQRGEKAFALMFPTLESVREACLVSPLEERLLRSPEAPIVLLRRSMNHDVVAESVAPGNPYLGAMLPYAPLHHLLLMDLGFPVVATSGNHSDEPICIDEHDARVRLGGIADFFLVHNRPIVRAIDDSIVRVVAGREMVLRRARGFAPLPVRLSPENRIPEAKVVLAVGAHLKNTVALGAGDQVFLSQHIGDLETAAALDAFHRVAADLPRLYQVRPDVIAADAHPDYLSSRFARNQPTRLITVQHHHAHVLSCMAENQLAPPVLGVAWDGSGDGLDGTVWGGEFLIVTADGCQRVAHVRPFRLPGAAMAVREPRRAALGLLYEWLGDEAFSLRHLPTLAAFSEGELRTLRHMLERGLNSPMTSSVGRLFDAVASLLGLRQDAGFEGQAAMAVEFAAGTTDDRYGIDLTDGVLDWAPLLRGLLHDRLEGIPPAVIAAKFHHALVDGMMAVARTTGLQRVALSGGCFQNKPLTELCVRRLRSAGFRPSWHQRVPPNDGGIALGQVLAASHVLTKEQASCV